jgi:hypothetical protein
MLFEMGIVSSFRIVTLSLFVNNQADFEFFVSCFYVVVVIHRFIVLVVVVVKQILIAISVNQPVDQVFAARDGDCELFFYVCLHLF